VPLVVPILGIVVNLSLIAARIHEFVTNPKVGCKPLLIAGVLGVVILILFLAMRPVAIPEEDES
jgi:hypothetical protein